VRVVAVEQSVPDRVPALIRAGRYSSDPHQQSSAAKCSSFSKGMRIFPLIANLKL